MTAFAVCYRNSQSTKVASHFNNPRKPSIPTRLGAAGSMAQFTRDPSPILDVTTPSFAPRSVAAHSGILGFLHTLPKDINYLPQSTSTKTGSDIVGQPVILDGGKRPFSTSILLSAYFMVKDGGVGRSGKAVAVDVPQMFPVLSPLDPRSPFVDYPPVGVDSTLSGNGHKSFLIDSLGCLWVTEDGPMEGAHGYERVASACLVGNFSGLAVSSDKGENVNVYTALDDGLAHMNAKKGSPPPWRMGLGWDKIPGGPFGSFFMKPSSPAVFRVVAKDRMGVEQAYDVVFMVRSLPRGSIVYNIRAEATGIWAGWQDLPPDVSGTSLTTESSPQAFLENDSGKKGFFVINNDFSVYECIIDTSSGSTPQILKPVKVLGALPWGETRSDLSGYGILGGPSGAGADAPRLIFSQGSHLNMVVSRSSSTPSFPSGSYQVNKTSIRGKGWDVCVASIQKTGGKYYLVYCPDPTTLTVLPLK